MLDQPPGHTWHVHWFPGEDVTVCPKEVDERIFLFGRQTRTDHSRLATVAGTEIDGFELDFLCRLRLVLDISLLSDFELTLSELFRCCEDFHHSIGYLSCRCEFYSFCVTVVGSLQVPLQREYSFGSWHLEYEVDVMRDSHKLGQSGSAEDGVIGSLEVSDLELDVLGAVVLSGPKGNWQNHLSKGYNRIA